MPDFSFLLDSRFYVPLLSAISGAIFWNFVALYRGRIQVLEYAVSHNRVGFSAEDATFGNVTVSWQGHSVTILFVSTVIIENNTASDYTDLRFKVFTTSTSLLTERNEVMGSTYKPIYTDEFNKATHIEPGGSPTPQQMQFYWHNREYIVPVLNRRQRVILTYLTTVPNTTDSPAVWVDLLKSGVTLRFRPTEPQIYGVPIRVAVRLGLAVCLADVLIFNFAGGAPWFVATVSIVAGLMFQIIGAALYRVFRVLWHIMFR